MLCVQVFCDRHFGGINYPVGGVGRIGEELVAGLQERGSHIEYKANVCHSSAITLELQLFPFFNTCLPFNIRSRNNDSAWDVHDCWTFR